jgi:hypothetical protein
MQTYEHLSGLICGIKRGVCSRYRVSADAKKAQKATVMEIEHLSEEIKWRVWQQFEKSAWVRRRVMVRTNPVT